MHRVTLPSASRSSHVMRVSSRLSRGCSAKAAARRAGTVVGASTRTTSASSMATTPNDDDVASSPSTSSPSSLPLLLSSRRSALLASAALPLSSLLLLPSSPASAIQGLTAGRIPGLSATPDASGLYTYVRPEGKSGGHGVGWSEIPRYAFKVPEGWQETPVSIADLGGTEIDLRFGNADQGQLSVVVAPVLRFIDVGFNADVRIEEIGPPEKIIAGFAPELFGAPLQEEDTLETETNKKGELTYYSWVLKPPAGGPGGNVGGRRLVAATAFKNRMFLMALSANPRQWRRAEDALRGIVKSFVVKV